MLRLLAVLMPLVLAGCGSPQAPASPQQGTARSATPTVGRCPVESTPVVDAKTVATVDLDGNGSLDPIRLTSSTSPCPDQLFAQLGDTYASVHVQAGSRLAAYGVELPSHEGALLAVRSDHPRGGFQLGLYAADHGALVELEVDGRSLLPFIALDVLEHPLSVDCEAGGVVVTEAVAHQPSGAVHAWDVKRTSYAVDGTRVTKGASSSVAENVRPDQLEAKYPELVQHTMFKSCRTPG